MSPILLDIPIEIQTERLLMRRPRPGDGPALFESVSSTLEELKLWMPWAYDPMSPERSEELCRRAEALFILREDIRYHLWNAQNTLVGVASLLRIDWQVRRFEIGYWIDTRHKGQGYATEAAGALEKLAFTKLGARRVEIRCDTANVASAAIAAKLRFNLEGILRANLCAPGNQEESRDSFVFSKLA